MATSKNAVTGDLIQTKIGDQSAYADGWDRIFGKGSLADVLEQDICPFCNVKMKSGFAIEPVVESGCLTIVPVPPTKEPKIIPCRKCPSCGYSRDDRD